MPSATQIPATTSGAFDVTVLRSRTRGRSLVFAAGRGGNPLRHAGLLQDFADRGFLVVAPHFDMLASPIPTAADLTERGRRLAAVIARHCPSDAPLCGVGHSLGAVVLLALAGARASTRTGADLVLPAGRPFHRLALFAPPTDFFRRPGALAAVTVPTQVWAGGQDRIAPPDQARFLAAALRDQAPVDLHVVDRAGHFSFMDDLPPDIADPHPARRAFLRSLAEDTGRFLAA